MRLFDDILRKDTGPAFYSEDYFTYLNRSARPEAEKVRWLLETWFSHYPQKEQVELRERFRMAELSAFYELFLHELLLKLGCEVEIHPQKEDADGKHPDFLVKPPDGYCFYIEAVLATGESKEEEAARNRINTVYDCINDLNSPNFFIGINHVKGTPRTQPSAN